MTTIRSFSNQAEASLGASFLKANGIEAVLLDDGGFDNFGGGVAVPVRLQVPEEDAAQALELLESGEDLPGGE
jgi:Putative prokaryotic signal transducing protein